MKQGFLLIVFSIVSFTAVNAQDLPKINVKSLFYGLSSNSSAEIRFVNGWENKRILNYEPEILEKFPDSIHNPEKIKFVSVSYISDSALAETINDLRYFPNLEYLEIKTATEFREEDINKEFILPEDLSGIKGIRFLQITGSYKMNYQRLFERLKDLENLQYLSLGHHLNDVDLPDNFAQLQNLKGIKFSGFGGLNFPEGIAKMENISSIVLAVEGFENLSKELEKLAQLPNLKRLQLSYAEFDAEDYKALQKMEDLKSLTFFNSEFNDLQDLFDLLPPDNQLKELKFINLSTAKSPIDYSNLISLKKLEIQNTRDSKFVPSKSLYNLENLEHLTIDGSDLYNEIPKEIKNLSNLIELDVSDNNLESISSEIGNLKNLKVLDISDNNIKELPKEIGDLIHLKVLNANGNQLKKLPETIGELEQLNILSLNQNRLQYLPQSITNLIKLEKLKLSENNLLELPENIGNLRNIQEIPLTGNFLQKLPDSFVQLKKLEELNLSNNNLKQLPQNIGRLKELERIFVGNNKNYKITKYERGRGFVIDTARKPRTNNDLTEIPKSLATLKSLKRLSFSNLENVDQENFFDVLFKLQSSKFTVRLNNSGITNLPKSGWENFKGTELWLSGDIIPEIPKNIIYAPFLASFSFTKHPEDGLSHSYSNRNELLAFFEAEGFIPFDSIPKTREMAKAYLSNAYHQQYFEDSSRMLSLMEKAFKIDSSYTAKHIREDTYAEALLAGEAYYQAIEFFTQAIKRDTAQNVRILNFIIPQFRNRAKAYLEVGDTISAIRDLEIVSRKFGSNDWGDAGLLARKIKKDFLAKKLFKQGINFYQQQIEWHAKNNQVDYGYQLSLLELYIIAGKTSEAKDYLNDLQKLNLSSASNRTLLNFFDIVLKILEGEETAVEIKNFSSSGEFSGWSFELFKNWLKQADLPPQKRHKMISLTNKMD